MFILKPARDRAATLPSIPAFYLARNHMWITWDFVGPKLAGPSCAFADVYAHLGDHFWHHRWGGYVWISEMDDQYLRNILWYLQENPRSHKRYLIPYFQKEIELREFRNPRPPQIVRPISPFQLTLI